MSRSTAAVCALVSCALLTTVSAHSGKTHVNIGRKAVEYLKQNVTGYADMSDEVVERLLVGAVREDTDETILRTIFHFLPSLDTREDLPGNTAVKSDCDSIKWGLDGSVCQAFGRRGVFLFEVEPQLSKQNWIIAMNPSWARDPRIPDDGWTAFGYVLHLLEDVTSPAHARNDPHPPGTSDSDTLEGTTRFPLSPPDGTALVTRPEPDDFFKELQRDVEENYFSRDSAFHPFLSGPESVAEVGDYFLDARGRKIAHKGRRYKIKARRGEPDRRYAGVDDDVADEQFFELGPKAVLYAASFIHHYVKKWPLKVTVTGPGTVAYKPVDADVTCTTTCTDDVVTGATVRLTATPAAGSTFTGWSGDCVGATATYDVVVSAASACVATFNPVGPSVGLYYVYAGSEVYAGCNSPDGDSEEAFQEFGTINRPGLQPGLVARLVDVRASYGGSVGTASTEVNLSAGTFSTSFEMSAGECGAGVVVSGGITDQLVIQSATPGAVTVHFVLTADAKLTSTTPGPGDDDEGSKLHASASIRVSGATLGNPEGDVRISGQRASVGSIEGRWPRAGRVSATFAPGTRLTLDYFDGVGYAVASQSTTLSGLTGTGDSSFRIELPAGATCRSASGSFPGCD